MKRNKKYFTYKPELYTIPGESVYDFTQRLLKRQQEITEYELKNKFYIDHIFVVYELEYGEPILCFEVRKWRWETEKEAQARLRKSETAKKRRKKRKEAKEQRERKLLKKLKDKYEGGAVTEDT